MEGMKDCGPAKAKAKKVMEKKILKSMKSEPAAGEQLWAAEIPASSLGKVLSASSVCWAPASLSPRRRVT